MLNNLKNLNPLTNGITGGQIDPMQQLVMASMPQMREMISPNGGIDMKLLKIFQELMGKSGMFSQAQPMQGQQMPQLPPQMGQQAKLPPQGLPQQALQQRMGMK